jgi:predicted membrane protein
MSLPVEVTVGTQGVRLSFEISSEDHKHQKAAFTYAIPAFTYFPHGFAYLVSLNVPALRSFANKFKNMETNDKSIKPAPTETKTENSNGRLWAGLIVVVVGLVFLAESLDVDVPDWLFSWKMLIIGIGLYVGAKQSFKPGGWLIPVAVGTVFIADEYLQDLYLKPYLIPVIIIGIGLYIIFKPRRNGKPWRGAVYTETNSESLWESVSIFGGNKNVISKDFRGGEMVTIFGGSEINMTQADINGVVTIEVVQIFGGTKLIVPANWKIQTSELVSIFGSTDDKRQLNTNQDDTKVLNLKGVSIFGGIDIRSY